MGVWIIEDQNGISVVDEVFFSDEKAQDFIDVELNGADDLVPVRVGE